MHKKIAAVCLIVSVFFIVDNLGAEVIVNHMMTKDPKGGTGCEPPIPSYTFAPRDTRAYCYLEVDDIIEGDTVTYNWYDPDGTFYLDWIHTFTFTGNGCAWDYIDIRNDDPARMPGEWHVDVFYNDTFQFTENFTIEEGSCAVRQLYGDSSAKTQFLRSVRDNVLQTTPEGREIIKLYYQWSPVIVKAVEADEAFKGDVKEIIDEIVLMVGGSMN
jgi:hypothetical protein